MNYTDSVEDLMIFSPQYAQADDGSWAKQLKAAEGLQIAMGTGNLWTHLVSLDYGWWQLWRQILGW